MAENKPDLYSIIVDMNGRLGQALQIAADTKDDVSKIKEIQSASVTNQTQFQVMLTEHFKDHAALKDIVTKHDVRIKVLEDSELVRNKALKWIATIWAAAISLVGWVLLNGKEIYHDIFG